MTSLADLMFPPGFPSPELLARLVELDLLPADVERLVAEFDAFKTATIDQLADADARFAELAAAVARLDTQLNPPPVPPPVPDTVHVSATQLRTSTVNLCWTAVQDTEHTAATRDILDKCSHGKNHHIIGFGANLPIQTSEGGPYDFTYLDSIFGYPNRSDGWFGAKGLRIVTMCGSPPYMRVAKPGTAPMPMGPATTGLYDYLPPHWSHHDNFAKLGAAIVDRYQIDILHEWNEWKGESIGSTLYPGSVLVPPGSGLPQFAGSTTNRWAMEMHTDRFNKMWTRVKAIRPQCKVMGPYMVTRTYTASPAADMATGTFPKDLHGAWGAADWKAMQAVMYVIENSVGMDGVCLDTKTSSNDQSILPEYEWDGLQKITDWQKWLGKLALFDRAKYARPEADAGTLPLWFAEGYSRVIGGLTPANHQRAVAIDAWSYINYVLPNDVAGWVRWQPEGDRNAADSASAHSISLWHAKGSAKSLQETEAVPMYAGLVEHFPPGTPLHAVAVDHELVAGIASDTTVCLVSQSAGSVDLTFNGEPLTLTPYDVRFVAR